MKITKAKKMTTYIILDYSGHRKGTIKANNRIEAHNIYADGIDWFLRHTFCVSEGEYNNIKTTFKKL